MSRKPHSHTRTYARASPPMYTPARPCGTCSSSSTKLPITPHRHHTCPWHSTAQHSHAGILPYYASIRNANVLTKATQRALPVGVSLAHAVAINVHVRTVQAQQEVHQAHQDSGALATTRPHLLPGREHVHQVLDTASADESAAPGVSHGSVVVRGDSATTETAGICGKD